MLKNPDPKLMRLCRSYLNKVEPLPQGKVVQKGQGLIPGFVEGEISTDGNLLYVSNGERPSIESLALAEGIIFESLQPDSDLLALCHNVGLAAVGGISAQPEGALLLDGLRGNLHELGPIEKSLGDPSWEDKIVQALPVPVLAALDTPEDAEVAKRRGAAGIGLIRSEHFCQHGKLLPLLQQLMLLDSGPLAERRAAELGEALAESFAEVFQKAPEGPIMVRLIDPPAHEFLDPGAITRMQTPESPNFKTLFDQRDSIAPTLVQRGLRIHWRQPALFSALIKALDMAQENNPHQDLRLLLPMVSSLEEIKRIRKNLEGRNWKIGATLETPAAISQASSWIDSVDFFTIGGNDLAQTFWGLSRDDRRDLHLLLKENFLSTDPFQALDPLMINFLKPLLETTQQAEIPVNFCGQQVVDVASAQALIDLGIDMLTCDVSTLVPLRLALSNVTGP